jgi:peroxiredoxin
MKSFIHVLAAVSLLAGVAAAEEPAAKVTREVAVGAPAPAFVINDTTGKPIDLAQLTARGPVLVRLTCGCAGCDKELAYFQALHDAYKNAGLISLAVFKESDAKVAAYAREKKIHMLYAVDPQGRSWEVFQTKSMPTNFLIAKGGKIIAIAAGCDPSGLLAKKLSEKVARVVNTNAVDVKKQVEQRTQTNAK